MKFTLCLVGHSKTALNDIQQAHRVLLNPNYDKLDMVMIDRKLHRNVMAALKQLVSCRYFQKIHMYVVHHNEIAARNVLQLVPFFRSFYLSLGSSLNKLPYTRETTELIGQALLQNTYVNFWDCFRFTLFDRLNVIKLDLLKPIQTILDMKGNITVQNGHLKYTTLNSCIIHEPGNKLIFNALLRNRLLSETWSPQTHLYQVYWKQITVETCLLLGSFDVILSQLSSELWFIIFGLL